jgi:hypothetical protein
MIITNGFIIAGSSGKNGAWNKDQLEILGVKWPPKRGWKRKVIGKVILDKDAQRFLELTGLRKSERRKNRYEIPLDI